ncbi:MAG: hypothetical protein FWB75_01180 [Oscillospiraceae bacterium]|nr:hypothetical protein [Oscillospiraceae bacterium]
MLLKLFIIILIGLVVCAGIVWGILHLAGLRTAKRAAADNAHRELTPIEEIRGDDGDTEHFGDGVLSRLQAIAAYAQRYGQDEISLSDITGYVLPFAEKLFDYHAHYAEHAAGTEKSGGDVLNEGAAFLESVLDKKLEALHGHKAFDIATDIEALQKHRALMGE